jgi:dethiobiotin synthetase
MATGYFITGTDTGVGKTLASCALLYAFAARGKAVVGMKPVAAGCENGKWMDVEFLIAASNIAAPREWINPYALTPPVAPHIAAKRMGVEIDTTVILQACHALQNIAEIVIVEGIGGFLVPLNSQCDTGDMALALGFPVILVVGMRLGCLNHALLTAQAVRTTGLPLAGWVANQVDPHMIEFEENVRALEQRLACPLLGVLPLTQDAAAQKFSALLSIAKLELAG